MDVADLRAKVKDLQSATSEKEIAAILEDLKGSAKVTEKILRETKAGLAVGKLRSHASKEVSDLAKELVKKWKTEVERTKTSGSASPTADATEKGRAASVKSETPKPLAVSTAPSNVSKLGVTPSPTTPRGYDSSNPRNAATDGVTFNTTGDRTRDTCAQLVYDALASDSGAPVDLLFKRAQSIEAKVFLLHNQRIQGEYRTKMRSLYSNLKDKSNPSLRESVVSGDLPVDKLVHMSSQELASEERKATVEKIKQENLFNTLAAGEAEAETDAFQCSKCKQRKTRYRQAQTRSADEPMTTFVTCTNCNNRWKFS